MNLPLVIVAAAGVMAMLASCASPYQTPAAQPTATPAEAAMANAVFQEVNAYRRTRGCAPVQRHQGLDGLARRHSQFLRANRGKFDINGKDLSHDGFDQRAVIAQRLYNIQSIGENLAAATIGGSAAAPFIVKLWANSPSHDHNMRNTWANTGIGVAIADDGKVFVTQIFGTQASSSHSDSRDRLRQH
jgi:uncharacterized protein YkwD